LGASQVFATEADNASASAAQHAPAGTQAAPVDAVTSQQAALSQPAQPQTSQTHAPPEQQAQAASQLPQTQAWDKVVESATAERNAKPAAAASMTTANRAVRAFNMIFLSNNWDDMDRIETPTDVADGMRRQQEHAGDVGANEQNRPLDSIQPTAEQDTAILRGEKGNAPRGDIPRKNATRRRSEGNDPNRELSVRPGRVLRLGLGTKR